MDSCCRETVSAYFVLSLTQGVSALAELASWPQSRPDLATLAGPPLPAIRLAAAAIIGVCAGVQILQRGSRWWPYFVTHMLIAGVSVGGAGLVACAIEVLYSPGLVRAVAATDSGPLLCCAAIAIAAIRRLSRTRQRIDTSGTAIAGVRERGGSVDLAAAITAVAGSLARLLGPASTGHLTALDVAGEYWIQFGLAGAVLILVAVARVGVGDRLGSRNATLSASAIVAILGLGWALRGVLGSSYLTVSDLARQLAVEGVPYLLILLTAFEHQVSSRPSAP